MKNIYLIGFMGSGKSTVASYLSHNYNLNIVEMDQWIVEQEGMSIPDIFAQKGEVYFRDAETNLLIAVGKEQDKVVSCGGGVVLRAQNVAEMKKSGYVVLLTANPETILERVGHDDNRPLLKGKKDVESIRDMMKNRQAKYEAAADFCISTDGKEMEEICKEILEKIEMAGE